MLGKYPAIKKQGSKKASNDVLPELASVVSLG